MQIYLLTNTLNGKKYVGQTVQNVMDRFDRHCARHPFQTVIHSAIKKYGRKAFRIEVIDKASSIEELNQKEAMWIEREKTLAPSGYNVRGGGLNFFRSESWKKKISEKMRGKRNGPKQKVICENTGDIFDSHASAARYFGLGRNVVYHSIVKNVTTRNGLKFRRCL